MTPRYTLDELLTVEDAAAELGISVRTAQGAAASLNLGRIFGKVRILTPDDVEALRHRPRPGRRWPAKPNA